MHILSYASIFVEENFSFQEITFQTISYSPKVSFGCKCAFSETCKTFEKPTLCNCDARGFNLTDIVLVFYKCECSKGFKADVEDAKDFECIDIDECLQDSAW